MIDRERERFLYIDAAAAATLIDASNGDVGAIDFCPDDVVAILASRF